MKKISKKGISLIVLIITIVVIIILAAVVILTLTKNNPIESAKEAALKEDIRAYQDELNMYISKEYQQTQGKRDSKITATGYEKDITSQEYNNSVYKYLSGFKKKYENKIAIKDDRIAYVGNDLKERNILQNLNVYMSKLITVKYVNEDGEELKPREYISTFDGKYMIDSPEIEGYLPALTNIIGEVTTDSEVLVEYCTECGDLAYIGLDSEGNETDVDSNIVAYTVAGIGSCKNKNIVIPRTHNSKPVIKIKEKAFNGNKTIKNLIIQDNITNIESNALNNISNLKNIKINAENISNISGGAEVLELGESVKEVSSIGYNNLKTLIINSNNINLTAQKFISTSSKNFKNIIVNEGNTKFKVEDNVLYSKDGKILYLYPSGKEGKYEFPSSVEKIVNRAFINNTYINEIYIPETVKVINTYLFQGCTNLHYVTINAANIPGDIFNNSRSQKKLCFGTNVKSIGTGGSLYPDPNSVECEYFGTMEEWNKINKGKNWYKAWGGVKVISSVKCTDGVINLE